MALLWADSFDHYGAGSTGREMMLEGAYAVIGRLNESVNLNSTRSRTGPRSLQIYQSVGARSYVRRVVNSEAPRIIGFGFGLYLPALPPNDGNAVNNPHGVFFKNAATTLVSLAYRQDGSIQVYRGLSSGTTLGTSDAGVLAAGTFIHLEVAVCIDPVVGWVEIRRDGVTRFRVEDVNTGNMDITNIEFGAINSANFTFDSYYDDVFCWDTTGEAANNFLGPVRILTLFPESVGDTEQWTTVGVADAVDAINNVPPDGDTTYIAAEEVGETINFTMPELPPEISHIDGVYVPFMARLEDAGAGDVRFSWQTGTEVATGKSLPLTPSYSYHGDAFPENPDGGGQWTKAEFESSTLILEKSR